MHPEPMGVKFMCCVIHDRALDLIFCVQLQLDKLSSFMWTHCADAKFTRWSIKYLWKKTYKVPSSDHNDAFSNYPTIGNRSFAHKKCCFNELHSVRKTRFNIGMPCHNKIPFPMMSKHEYVHRIKPRWGLHQYID